MKQKYRHILNAAKVLALAPLMFGCAHSNSFNDSKFRPNSWEEFVVSTHVNAHSVQFFERNGPFSPKVFLDHDIQLSFDKKIKSDYFIPKSNSDGPLLIIQHGNRSFKETHRVQARLLASWGFRVLALQLPNTNKWNTNAKILADVVALIRNRPRTLLGQKKSSKIYGIGHSFGGGATAIAAAAGMQVDGIILLDPAMFSSKHPENLRKLAVPTILIGADRSLFKARRRGKFYQNIPANIIEVSIAGAGHWEAQFPSRNQLRWFGFDPMINSNKQEYYAAAIVASAFSFVHSSPLDFAWHVFKQELHNGKLKLASRK